MNNHKIYGDSWYYDYLRTTWDRGHNSVSSVHAICMFWPHWDPGGRGLYGPYTSVAAKVNTSGQNLTLLGRVVLPNSPVQWDPRCKERLPVWCAA